MSARDRIFSRRDFLKLGSLGLAGLFRPKLASLFPWQDAFETQQGRVTARLIWIYDQPSPNARRTNYHWRDTVLPVTNVAVNEDPAVYNRIWYEIGQEGFAYSGNIQPVQTLLNVPTRDIPEHGVLGEVSVPFTDAHERADLSSSVVYRMYYESVHWVKAARVSSADGKIWYQVLDDKYQTKYFAPAEHLRILADEELAPLSPDLPEGQKRIEVHLEDQLLFAYEGDAPVFVTRVASGGTFLAGIYETPTGEFMTYHKRPTRHMAAGDITASGFDLAGVPWVMYITEAGISMHGTYWHNDFGHPRSHGCINLTPAASKWLFRWTTPAVRPDQEFAYRSKGTQVEIRK